jgi:hypothetical protein
MHARPATTLSFAILASIALPGPAAGKPAKPPSPSRRVPLHGFFQRSFHHTGEYTNPYVEASATATFAAPDGRTLALPLFWDGGTTWRLRFSPNALGRWSWSVSSPDPGLDGWAGAFVAVRSTLPGGIKRRGDSPRHFEREDGSPFFWLGDTQWRAFGTEASEGLDRASVFHYLDVRSTQGVNYIHSSLMSSVENEGGPIFGSVADETLNPLFFREADRRVRHMNARGITAGIVLAWGSDTPWSWQSFASDTARRRYARYVAARYSAFDVVFILSGEWDEAGLPPSAFSALGAEVAAADPHDRLIGIHGTGSVERFADEAWMSFGDYQQLYSDLHGNVLAARDHGKPVVNAEYAYYLRDQDGDGVVDKPNSATLAEIRAATWDIAMAGGYFVTGWGTTYLGGRRDPGPFNPDDPRNDDWEEDVQHVRTLFAGLDWWTLEPSDALLAGSGTRYVLAATGTAYVAYVRGAAAPVTLSLGGAAAASYDVRLFDPRTGGSTGLPAYSGTGPVALSPPDAQDWVFVLTRTGEAVNLPPSVDAGPDRTVDFPGPADLAGSVSDDGLPMPPGALTVEWSQVDGPASTHFTDVESALTTATFSAPGTYVLRLTATDGSLTSSDDVTVTAEATAPEPVLSFTERTAAAGLDLRPVDIGGWHGTYVCDYDGDGDEDLFMTSHGIGVEPDSGRNALFRNDGSGRFNEVAQAAGVDGGLHGRYTRELHGASFLDYDGDGDFDLFMPNTDPNASDTSRHGWDELYRNEGDGRFTDVSVASGLPRLDYGRRGAIAGDFDRDGLLDVFVVDMIQDESGVHSVPSPYRALYRGRPGGLFCLEGSADCPASGVSHLGWSEGATTLDHDGDGDLDILEADETSGHGLLLWDNDGSGRFTEIGAWRGLPSAGVDLNGSVTAGDVDNDGDLDVFVVVETSSGGGTVYSGRLYRNDGGFFTFAHTFADRSSDAEHMFFADLDNDGDLDLVWAGVYLNDGTGHFGPNRAGEMGVSPAGRGGMAFDADGDGDLDLVFNRDDRTQPYLRYYRNDVESPGAYLDVRLGGPGARVGAPGAKVSVYEEGRLGDRQSLLGYRVVATATGFVSGPSPVQHFGLGERTAVDVRVVFPGGQVEERRSVPAKSSIAIFTP